MHLKDMKKTIFAIMTIALVMLAVGCSEDEAPQQKELTLAVSEVTDNTAILHCTFTPKTAASYYQVQIGKAVSEEYSKDMQLTIANLASGKKHTVVATIFDADHKQVGTTEVEFRTTGIPDNPIQKDVVITDNTFSGIILAIGDGPMYPLSTGSEVLVYTHFFPTDGFTEYSLSCDKEGEFSETGRFTSDKTLTLSNLESGTEYTITATLYNPTSGETKDITETFTKK